MEVREKVLKAEGRRIEEFKHTNKKEPKEEEEMTRWDD